VLSTHFRKPHRPSERALRMVDLYCKLLPMGGTSIAAAQPFCSSDEKVYDPSMRDLPIEAARA